MSESTGVLNSTWLAPLTGAFDLIVRDIEEQLDDTDPVLDIWGSVLDDGLLHTSR